MPQLSGGAMLGIGIWLRVDDSILELIKLTEFATDGDQMENVSYVLIAVGAFVFLVGFLGCFGAITENRCMLGVVSCVDGRCGCVRAKSGGLLRTIYISGAIRILHNDFSSGNWTAPSQQ